MFVLVVLLLHGHVWGSIRVHHLWVRPCFSSSVLHVWFPLKLVDKFTYLGSSVASTEKDIDTRLKAWTAINRLSIIWKSDLTDKMKRIDNAIWMHYMDSNKTAVEEARRQLHKNAASNLEQVLAVTPHKTPTVRPPASYHENYSS